jgi:hypothetical protein
VSELTSKVAFLNDLTIQAPQHGWTLERTAVFTRHEACGAFLIDLTMQVGKPS